MSDSQLYSGWNSTDDAPEQAVPVHSVPSSATSAASMQPGPNYAVHGAGMSDRGRRQLSAVSGIATVIVLALLFSVGADALRGDLGMGNEATTVTINDLGEFVPTTVTLSPGDKLIVQNNNANPQVLKASDSKQDVMGTQVLFDRPFEFTVPASAAGNTYEYFSETLPESSTLTLVILANAASARAASSTSSASSAVAGAVDIPIPSHLGLVAVSSVSSSSSMRTAVTLAMQSSRATTTVAPPTQNGTAVIDVGMVKTTTHAAAPDFSDNATNIPTNPFTVGNLRTALETGILTPGKKPTKAPVNTAALHSGAPLMAIKKPNMNAQTGPGVWIALVAALGLFSLAYRLFVNHRA